MFCEVGHQETLWAWWGWSRWQDATLDDVPVRVVGVTELVTGLGTQHSALSDYIGLTVPMFTGTPRTSKCPPLLSKLHVSY